MITTNDHLVIFAVMFLCGMFGGFLMYNAYLRKGQHMKLDFNPINWIFGKPTFELVKVEEDILLIEIDQFKGDQYMVEFDLFQQWRIRKGAPGRLGRKLVGHQSNWSVESPGIPFRRGHPMGDYYLAGTIKVNSREGWRLDSDLGLVRHILEERKEHGYRPPIGEVTSIEETDMGIEITGEVWDEKTRAAIRGTLPKYPYGVEHGTMFAPGAFKDALIKPIPLTMGMDVEPTKEDDGLQVIKDFDIYSVSLDAQPNAFGEAIHLVNRDLRVVEPHVGPIDLTQPCTYEQQWTDEVGSIDVCTEHGQNSKYAHEEGPNRPCLAIDPWTMMDGKEKPNV